MFEVKDQIKDEWGQLIAINLTAEKQIMLMKIIGLFDCSRPNSYMKAVIRLNTVIELRIKVFP